MADPHVISALRSKRAELSGELIAAENRIVQRRADSPMTAREMAYQLAARYQIAANNPDAMNVLVAKVRNSVARQKGVEAKSGAMRKHGGWRFKWHGRECFERGA